MAQLHYVSVISLDGYIGDGHYDWSKPAPGSTAFITEVIRPFGTYLYGRKNYETMAFWDTPAAETMGEESREFGRVWRSAEKVVFSRSLASITASNTRLEREFEGTRIRELKARSPHDLCIGGPTLAAQAIGHGLVEEIHLFVVPSTIGSRIPVIPVFPQDPALHFDLLEHRAFSAGWVYLRYRLVP